MGSDGTIGTDDQCDLTIKPEEERNCPATVPCGNNFFCFFLFMKGTIIDNDLVK